MLLEEFHHQRPISSGQAEHPSIDCHFIVFKYNSVSRSIWVREFVEQFVREYIAEFIDVLLVEFSSFRSRYRTRGWARSWVGSIEGLQGSDPGWLPRGYMP